MNRIIRSVVFVLTLALALPASAAVPLPALQELAATGLKVSALFSVNGETVASLTPETRANPASVTKLFTAALAVRRLGPDRRLRTEVFRTPDGRLFILGSGDPELTVRGLEELASCVAAEVNRQVSSVVFSTGPFNRDDLPPGYAQKTTNASYRASIAGLQINRNAVSVSVGKARPGAAPTVSVQPGSDYFRVVNKATASAAGKPGQTQRRRNPLHFETSTGSDGRMVIEITGRSNPARAAGATFRVDNPAWFAAATFVDALKRRGVRVGSELPIRGVIPAGAERVCFVSSPTIRDILVPMLKESINPVAETMLRLAGAEGASGPVGFAEGAASLKDFLQHEVLAPPESFLFTNGSGLYGANSVSARAVVDLVHWILGTADVKAVILTALPVGGVDGTLKRRFRQESIRGRVHAKTGTLDEAISLAGWVELPDGRNLEFAVLVEGRSKLQAARVRNAIDSSVVKVFNSVSSRR